MRVQPSRCKASNHGLAGPGLLASSIVALALFQPVQASFRKPSFYQGWQGEFLRQTAVSGIAKRGPPSEEEERVPLKITNRCDATIWPGIVTQSGEGPGTGGFELEPNHTSSLWVSADWQGRVWGRTNCTVNGDSCSCETGDCFGLMDCEFSVSRANEASFLLTEATC
jgi:hypothetical protein